MAMRVNFTATRIFNESVGEEDFHEDSLFSISHIFPLLIAVLICLTNGMVIAIIFKTPSLRKKSNYILASMALTDFLTGIAGIPLIYLCTFMEYGPFCISSTIFLRFISISTSLHILAVSGDRYIAIVHTMRYEQYLYRFYRKETMLVLWLLPLIVALLQLTWIPINISPQEEMSAKLLGYNIVYQLTCMSIFYVTPFIMLTYIYIIILKEVKRQRQKTEKLLIHENRRKTLLKRQVKERRAVLIFLVMIITYGIFWLPYYAIVIQHHLGNELFYLPEWLESILYKCRFVSSFLNPILYSLGKLDLRKAAAHRLTKIYRSRTGATKLSESVSRDIIRSRVNREQAFAPLIKIFESTVWAFLLLKKLYLCIAKYKISKYTVEPFIVRT